MPGQALRRGIPSVPDGTGRYAYGLNNPVRYVDPSGHYTCSDIYCHGGPSIRFRYGKGGPVSGGVRKDDGEDPSENTNELQILSTPPPPVYGPPQPSAPSGFDFDYAVEFTEFGKYIIDFLINGQRADILIKKGFILSKAVNPNPVIDFGLGVTGQAISDINNSDLTIGQRFIRAGVVGSESLLTGIASDVAGALGFLGGEAVFQGGGGFVGYPLASLSVSVYSDYVFWKNYNNKHFEEWGLGSYP